MNSLTLGVYAHGGFPIFLVIILALIPLALLAFWIWMFLDLFANSRLTDLERILWAIAILFFGPLAALIYYFVASTKRP